MTPLKCEPVKRNTWPVTWTCTLMCSPLARCTRPAQVQVWTMPWPASSVIDPMLFLVVLIFLKLFRAWTDRISLVEDDNFVRTATITYYLSTSWCDTCH